MLLSLQPLSRHGNFREVTWPELTPAHYLETQCARARFQRDARIEPAVAIFSAEKSPDVVDDIAGDGNDRDVR